MSLTCLGVFAGWYVENITVTELHMHRSWLFEVEQRIECTAVDPGRMTGQPSENGEQARLAMPARKGKLDRWHCQIDHLALCIAYS